MHEGRKEIMFFWPFNGFLKIYRIIIKILWKLYEMYIHRREEIMFFCRFNRFLKQYWIIIKILWKLYEMYIQSIEEIMFFCWFNGFLNNSQPNPTNFQENSLSLLYLSHTQNLAWQTRENHQKINRNDPYNPDQELTWFKKDFAK